jgi:hypothetical protein
MLGTVATSALARAQEFLHDSRVSQGSGVRAGTLEVHPGLAAEVGYDSNYLGRSDKTGTSIVNGAPTSPQIDTGELRVTPSIAIQVTPRERKTDAGMPSSAPYAIQAGLNGTYREFFNATLSNQRNMSANANLGLAIMPGHEWSGSISGIYSRLVQPTVYGNPDASYNNDMVTGLADLAAQPHLGALDWHLGYMISGTVFEQASGSPYNNLINTGYTRGRWRFAPRASLLGDAQFSSQNYSDPRDAGFTLHTQTPVRARVGLEGLLLPVLSVSGVVGYGTTLTNARGPNDPTVQNYSSVIGNAEVRFSPGGPPGTIPGKESLLISTITIGYNRDFQGSFLGGFYGIDRAYLKADYFFGGLFLFSLSGGVGAIEHPNLYFASTNTAQAVLMAKSYTDVMADATAFAEYRLLPSVGVNATVTYQEMFSDTLLPVAPNSTLVYDLNIRHIMAFAGIRWFM